MQLSKGAENSISTRGTRRYVQRGLSEVILTLEDSQNDSLLARAEAA